MNRTVYAFSINRMRYKHRIEEKIPSLREDLLIVMKRLIDTELKDKFEDFKTEKKAMYIKKCYFYNLDGEQIDNEDYFEADEFSATFITVKYNTQRRVRDTATLVERGVLKNEKDGDEEKTSIAMKFCDDDSAICLMESNRSGASIKNIINYINIYIKKYYREQFQRPYYRLEYEPLLSKNFILSLEKTRKIKMCTLTVAQEELYASDGKRFANRDDICEDVDIVLRPATAGIGILRDSVERFYKLYYNKNRKVKKITIKADCTGVNDLSFDTEKLKEKMTVGILLLEKSILKI